MDWTKKVGRKEVGRKLGARLTASQRPEDVVVRSAKRLQLACYSLLDQS